MQKGSENMNKIFKVIWSKTRNCYVVASELAKGRTKAASTGDKAKRLALAAITALMLLPVGGYSYAADTATVTDTSTTQQTVYTKDGADNTFATKGSLTTEAADRAAADTKEAADRAAADTTLQSNIDKEATARETADTKLQTAVDAKANAADVYSKTDTDTKLADKANAADVYSKTETDNKLADKANAADVYSKTDTDTKLADKANAADVYSKTETDNKLADKANVADVYSKADADTTFATKTEVSKADTDLQKSIDEEARKRKYSVTNLEKADANEAAAREAADTQLDSRTSAVETKTASLTRVAAANSTSINESMTYKGNQYSATLQVNGSGAQIGVVNNEAAGLANDGGTAYTEYRARTGAIVSKATNDISSTSSNGQIIDTAGDTAGEYSQVATAKSTGTTFTYNDGTSSSSTTIKGNAISTGSIDATGNISAASVVDNTLTSGNYVTAGNTVGENIVALDTQAKANADAIDEEARKRKYSVTNLENADKQLQANIDKEAAAREAADVEEKAGRVAADTKLVDAVNGGLSLSNDNVLQKNTTTIDAQGNVTTSKTDANKMILNKGNDNQITLSDKGIKVGTNSSVVDKDGVYTGGDTYSEANAALKSDGSIKGADGKFTVDADGKVTAASGKIGNVDITSAGAVSGVTDLTASGTITGNKLTDGVASLQNGNLTTTGNINAHDIVATGDISGNAITGTSLNTQGGAISGGAITGTTITGTTGTFGSLTTTGDASVGGTLSSNGLKNTGNATTDTLTVNHNATVGGDLAVTGDITGKSLNVGTGAISGGQITGTGLDVGAGTIKTTGAVETGTLETTGNATIGGDLTVDKNLTVNGTFDAKTLSSTVDANNYTTINGGKTQSMNLKMDAATGETKASASTFDENGSNTWAKDDDSIGKSTVTADSISQKLSNTGDNPTVYAERTMSQGTDNKYSMVDTVKDGDKTNVASQSATESSDVVTDANGNTSTFRQRVDAILQEFNNADGDTLTKVEQTDTAITSQIGDGSAIKSVMNADGIANTATGKSITNNAADIINTSTNSVTNQVGSNKVVVDTTGVKSAYGDNTYTTWNAEGITNSTDGNMTNTVGGNKSETVTGTSTETVTGKKTENYKGGLETTVTGEEKHTVNGNQNITVNGTKSETVTGDVTEDYQSNMTTTVGKDQKTIVKGSQTNTIGGSQTTTVTGDSSLTAENITNEAKNKITNKALDVETDATSSIVQKVTNDAGSNTSTQLSYQTKEEMSQADGKTASYLRGAAEEKSQLTDGDKKTTVDTIAGQTNTNITDGTNTSNSLQQADQVASSVTDGTNTTVVNQDAKSLASSITDGTKANNTNNTVDKSEQLIKANGTQYSATSKTATKMEDALVSGSSGIDVIKNLDDAANPLISSAVTDGTNSTGVTQTAKDITNTAKNGTITNDAKDIVNNAGENMTNTVGKDLTTTVGGEMKTTVTGKTTENYNGGLETTITGEEKHTVNGSQTTTVTVDSSLSAKNITNTATEKLSNSATDIENKASTSILNQVGDNTSWKMTNGQVVESIKGADGQTNTTTTTADDTYQSVQNGNNVLAKRTSSTNDNLNITDGTNTYSKITTATSNKQTVTDGTETASTNLTKSASNTYITNGTQTVTNHIAADTTNTVMNEGSNGSRQEQTASQILDRVTDGTNTNSTTTTASGTTFENTAHNTALTEMTKHESGDFTKTTISGNTIETGQATMDYAEVMKDLGVHGNATVDGNTILGKEGANTTLTVNSKSTFKDTVKMEKTLEVDGTSTFNDKVTVTKGGLDVTGGTTTDTLHVTSTSTFDGKATFKDIVTMEKDLSVGGNATVAGSMTASSYKVGDKTYISESGINANNQKVVNVAAGDLSANSTDAVNGAQLYQTNERVTSVENRVGTVENRVDKLDSRVDKVGANAAALANLHPLEFDADSKWNIAAAVGGYKGETATAIGAFYRPNENVMVNVSSSFGTGENMYGGGISLRIGQGGNKARRNATNGLTEREKAMQKQIDSLTSRLDALLSVINPNMSKDFPDVPENHWAYEAVSRLAGNGVIQGYEDGKYHGDRTMTRYEMAEIIYNALSKGAKAEKKLVEEFKPELQAMAAQKKA